ncbi:MAG: hemerythrin domain-containing protein [Planctomycetota bacterium]|jgi:(p)ppGpp synthase/HD superfamily hydrolase
MSALIEEFKREHSEIVDALKEVEELGILSKEGQAKLMSVKAALLEHLKEEDEKFYPVLWKEAVQNKKLEKEIEVFAKDWEGVSKVVFRFFERYDERVLGASLLSDFETIIMVLRNRMRNEENFLYDEYEKIAQ